MDYAALAQKHGGTATAATSAPITPAPSATPDMSSLAAKYGGRPLTTEAPQSTVPKEPGALQSLAKTVFGPIATSLARPVQAAVALGGLATGHDISNEQIDAGTKKIPILGDLIAPTPKSYADIPKEIGRGAETVALGLSPIAGGALFGAGNSLEQGNDLLSTQTAFDTVLGAAGGKVLGLVGKPLIGAAGKVVGTITPQILKDVAAGGAKSITEFAANHQLLGGIAAPASESLAKGAQAIDTSIEGAFKKGGSAVQKVAQDQFPGMSPTNHYLNINKKDIIQPTVVNKAAYNKATDIFNDAKNKGIDLGEVANSRGIQHDQIIDGGRYSTADAAEQLRQNNFKISSELARPAIKAAEPGVALVPIENVRNAMISKVKAIPASQIGDEERATILKQIERRYADDSAAAKAHPNGYSLSDLHDARINAASNGGYKPGQSASDALKAQRSREEGRVFNQLFDSSAPDTLGIKPFKKELEKNFLLADYLDSLDTKKVPEGVTKKAVRLFGRATAATLGGKIGGFPGAILGSQYGDMLFSGFEALPNPIKTTVLNNYFDKRATNPAFDALRQYLGEQETARLLRKALPPAGKSSFKETSPTMFTTPGGVSTPNRGEAIDVAAVETGKAKKPASGRSSSTQKRLVDLAQQDPTYTPPNQLPTIKVGPKKRSPKSLNDIKF